MTAEAPGSGGSATPEAAPFDGKAFARGLSTAPGVYRMIAADGSVLYVGKAGALKKRVASYFSNVPRPARTVAMLAQIARMEVTVTRTEGEALLLENQLIKSLRPRYNVLLRDDKSYPYVLVTQEPWPRLALHRGPRSVPGRYFGPYPGVTAVRETLNMMHKLFRLRSCEDSVFRNRSRPCLQHQIGRCTAPCVGLVPAREYADAVRRATLFLEGRSDELARELGEAMEGASERLDFEEAARLRDLLTGVRSMQARQYVDGSAAELDVLAVAMQGTQACVLLLAFRDGRNLGTRAFFPKTNGSDNPAEVLAAFVSQYYAEQPPPREIVLDRGIEDISLLEEAFSAAAGRKVQIRHSVRGERAGYVDLARRNAELSLATELGSQAAQQARLESLRTLLGLDAAPTRIECFDISHTMGEATVASCVVFDAEGAVRGQYRRYNIAGIEPGDDYAAMQQALQRRFRRAVDTGEARSRATGPRADERPGAAREDQTGDAQATSPGEGAAAQPGAARGGRIDAVLPDLLLIDGGAGQVAQARSVLAGYGLDDGRIMVVGVAKGEERRAGHERLLLPDGRELRPGIDSPGLQLIQQVRDEAHRFAITGHRGRRQKARSISRLEDIPGIGPRRRASLLKHFGGLGGLKAAGAEEIAKVEGVSEALAGRIYATLHGLQDAAPAGPTPPSK
ncbi:excinuclease ABC subunit UvrC [Luteimonas viscosa]|uniref:UvrABC system protein C n=1 Tax=Luteimonas viscosa TaxID=1132694 RepID=A0A5D4XQ09_9GAMM|nr:excinuclease ABC subunit UvrC [Luteimonas viscosa]TYT24810.1 excinuclease ABC subunit UvrC [Luteimonas viscosa]